MCIRIHVCSAKTITLLLLLTHLIPYYLSYLHVFSPPQPSSSALFHPLLPPTTNLFQSILWSHGKNIASVHISSQAKNEKTQDRQGGEVERGRGGRKKKRKRKRERKRMRRRRGWNKLFIESGHRALCCGRDLSFISRLNCLQSLERHTTKPRKQIHSPVGEKHTHSLSSLRK